MASALKTRINDELKTAMRAKDKARVAVLRLINSEFKRIEVDERIELDDARVLVVLDKMLKQRRDSITQFEAAGRDDLADKEKSESTVIQEFLPAPLSDAELDQIVDKAIADSGASSMREMGQAMALIKPQVQGRADMGDVSKRIKARLA
ncbi:GatB/YqeY domain-containing protein [Gilvimarinus sp. SDUM040013]|uniref:GatB/YqeY domain-containing protein n=1 Tax=Gilvimarinus gilvus TaxID=3058038 RepID=A0ABU4RYL0_9GAMM|nr:GatB/YqeY domain-containing protein [Gilvimarinus sp. SDUM040013]MDO3385304.1 GatB/YqeY domain-containing protein [Gilvimarinus sp. SDUM040013]MDX6849287.1 GatB/YqeY domain-containing protein [Gilvimarinus sp. SDUM040013]